MSPRQQAGRSLSRLLGAVAIIVALCLAPAQAQAQAQGVISEADLERDFPRLAQLLEEYRNLSRTVPPGELENHRRLKQSEIVAERERLQRTGVDVLQLRRVIAAAMARRPEREEIAAAADGEVVASLDGSRTSAHTPTTERKWELPKTGWTLREQVQARNYLRNLLAVIQLQTPWPGGERVLREGSRYEHWRVFYETLVERELREYDGGRDSDVNLVGQAARFFARIETGTTSEEDAHLIRGSEPLLIRGANAEVNRLGIRSLLGSVQLLADTNSEFGSADEVRKAYDETVEDFRAHLLVSREVWTPEQNQNWNNQRVALCQKIVNLEKLSVFYLGVDVSEQRWDNLATLRSVKIRLAAREERTYVAWQHFRVLAYLLARYKPYVDTGDPAALAAADTVKDHAESALKRYRAEDERRRQIVNEIFQPLRSIGELVIREGDALKAKYEHFQPKVMGGGRDPFYVSVLGEAEYDAYKAIGFFKRCENDEDRIYEERLSPDELAQYRDQRQRRGQARIRIPGEGD